VAAAAWSVAEVEDAIADHRWLADASARWMVLDALDRLPSSDAGVDLDGLFSGVPTLCSSFDRARLDGFLRHVTGREQVDPTLGDPRGEEVDQTLFLLGADFVGFLRRGERVPFAVGELGASTLMEYLARQIDELPKPPRGGRRRGKPRAPALPPEALRPSRASLDAFLARRFQPPFTWEPYAAVAALALVPAWLRFLESRGLLAADLHARTIEKLRPLAIEVKGLVSEHEQDQALSFALAAWPTLQLPGMGPAVLGDADVDWAIAPPERVPGEGDDGDDEEAELGF